jgi:hypothetical protein
MYFVLYNGSMIDVTLAIDHILQPGHKEIMMETLKDDAKLADVIAKVNELVVVANQAIARSGPKSQRQMTEDDAKRIMLGDLADESHTKAAETLGLSYGQIYSARKGFTFKSIYQEMLKKQSSEKAKK